ncbi:hypothetical protein NITLEN_100050 [Nitrospira lenta]|uniref:Uncharacterized protein n=1 Tax=Nitrospira lenta TaxID=1436998 RepID=A0A330L5E3_9BACT|nr:hypothetical protein NITLEN_100050 [Nitrospira lenta]
MSADDPAHQETALDLMQSPTFLSPLPATARAKHLPLTIGIPAGRTKLHRRMGRDIDTGHAPVDKRTTVCTGPAHNTIDITLLNDHETPPLC